MSYFIKNIAYIIVPLASITEEMVNNTKVSFNSTRSDYRTSIDGLQCVVKVKTPISPVFDGYVWYNHTDIQIEMAKTEWVEI